MFDTQMSVTDMSVTSMSFPPAMSADQLKHLGIHYPSQCELHAEFKFLFWDQLQNEANVKVSEGLKNRQTQSDPPPPNYPDAFYCTPEGMKKCEFLQNVMVSAYDFPPPVDFSSSDELQTMDQTPIACDVLFTAPSAEAPAPAGWKWGVGVLCVACVVAQVLF